MRINNNLMAMNTYRQLGLGNSASAKSMEKLSSGMRINRAGDDAAGLAISEKMRGQIRGLNMASRNAQDGISMVQTAEGALNETQAILQRMRELAVQASSDTLVETDREKIQSEVDELATEITRIANTTEFNTQNLLNGGLSSETVNGNDVTFHIGANKGQQLTFGIEAMDAKTLGVAADAVTAEVSSATNVTAANISGTTGAEIVDGASISVTTALVTGAAATSAQINGSAAAAANVTTGGVLALEIDGTAVNVTIGDGDTYADIITAINTAANTALGTSGETYATDNSGTLQLDSLTTGTTSKVEVVSGAGTILADLKLSASSDTGEAAGADTYTVTFSDGGTNTVDVTGLTGSETSIAGTGDFAGLTLTTDGAFDENLAATVDVSLSLSSAASIDAEGNVTDATVAKGIDVSTRTAANDAIKTINDAINTVSEERAKLGAIQNRLDHTIKNLDTSAENLQAAESRIRDVDMAKEMMEFTKNNILQQAAQAMLAQANQAPQGVLQLLR